ncbi:uncharacterized protein LOC135842094 [Planococcus citri]|uniref:uncharacterized protein LOC135842094 n=1 Tax=Planococcus citri TaxID=170843 RepID=UPI0031F98CC8
MKFLRSLFTTLSILVLIEGTTSKEVFVSRNTDEDQLPLFKKANSDQWELAIPHASSESVGEAGYYYDESEDEFKVACPAYSEWASNKAEKWRKTDKSFEDSQLFILMDYVSAEKVCALTARPSIKKFKKTDENNPPVYCGKSEAELYEVGYPVLTNTETLESQFIPFYKICHSPDKKVGTLYTINQIVSPDLLLLTKKKWYQPNILQAFKSYLDDDLNRINTFYKENENFIYRFVGPYFMPTRIWEQTTNFPFNFTPIEYRSYYNGLIRADLFIQVFSKTTNTPLTLYSGTYETEEMITKSKFCGLRKCTENELIKFFWRILIDSKNHAIILVTQLTKLDCDLTENILCQDDDTRAMLETYTIGGCMYKCPVTETIIKELGLPATELGLNIEGILSLRLPMPAKNQGVGGSSDTDAGSATKYIGIGDFMGSSSSFAATLMGFDSELAQVVDAQGAVGGNSYSDGYGHSDGFVVSGDTGGSGFVASE